jgi:parallel beta-helix repeat protein
MEEKMGLKKEVLFNGLASILGTALLVLLPWAAVMAAAFTRYVATTGADTPTCGTVSAPCRTINYTLKNRVDLWGATIRLAVGTYNENIRIDNNHISLLPSGSNNKTNTFINGANTAPTIDIHDQASVSILNLTVKGGNRCISATQANLRVEQCNIRNSLLNEGISISGNTTAWLKGDTIGPNASGGVSVMSNSSMFLENCTIKQNPFYGIQVGSSSSADLAGCTVSNNTECGMDIYGASFASLRSNTISGNGQIGVGVYSNSALMMSGGNTISGNGSGDPNHAGLELGGSAGASIKKSMNRPVDKITGNNAVGISVNFNSEIYVRDGEVSSNSKDGVALSAASGAGFESTVTIKNNSGYGLRCRDASKLSRYVGTPTMSGNTLGNFSSYCAKY